MADENPTDVEAPVTGTKEDAVEPGAEDIDKPPKGAAVSKDEVVEKVAGASADKAPAEEPEAPKKAATKKPKTAATKKPKQAATKKPKKAAAEEPKKKATKKPKKEVAEGPEKEAAEEPKKAVAEEPAPAATEPAADAPAPVKAEAAGGAKPKEDKKAKGKAPVAEPKAGPKEEKKAKGKAPVAEPKAGPKEEKKAKGKAPAAEPKAGPKEEKKTEGKEPAAEPEAPPKEPERTFADELREEYGDIETATLDILPDLERKRDRLNGLAEEHKFKRDRLNGVTKQLAEERDSYNAQVRELVQAANEHRNNRNLLNTEVKDAKVIRDELNKKATEFNDVVTKLKRERQGETGGPNLNRMRNERKALEFKAMTQVLSAEKEKELMVMIQRLNIQIDEQEKKMEESREIRTALQDSRQSKEEAEAQHRMVSDLARQAQTAHDSMIELYEKADDIRKRADDCQGRFIANKQLADAEHKSHIDLIRKVHDYDKFISGLRRRDRRARKDRQEKAQKQVAEDMMDRFKKGEKLSTEDLLSLQTERF